MGYDSSISLGTLTINAAQIRLKKVPGTRKQIVGGNVIPKRIPDRTSTDWMGTINGTFADTDRHTDRDTLQTYRDNNNKVTLTDGLHNGDYYITGLEWLDDDNTPNQHRYVISIIQEQ